MFDTYLLRDKTKNINVHYRFNKKQRLHIAYVVYI